MGNGILLIVVGLVCIFLPKTQYYKEYIEKHNFVEREEFYSFIRTIMGWVLIGLGIMSFFSELLT